MRSYPARLLIGFLLLLTGSFAHAGPRPSVVFLSPDDSRFWQMVAGFMEAVAEDLEVDLEVQYDRESHRFSYLRMAKDVLSREEKPDYLLFMCKEHVTESMLRLTDGAGVKAFTFNTDVPDAARASIGMPRTVLPGWLGHLSPDNIAAGRVLVTLLGKQAEQLGLASEPSIPMVALSGTLDSSAAKDRNRGLLAAAVQQRSELLQLVYANWSRDLAREKTEVLLKRYPNTASIWSASDGMALGAIEAAQNAGRAPGKDLLVGGIDWEPEALEKIRQGELLASMGQHFMGGGLALLLLHDYHHGRDFGDMSPDYVFRYELEPATRDNIDQVQRIMDPENWSAVDFRQFSRVGQMGTAKSVPGPDALLDAMTGALAR
ncbi:MULTISPECIES: ABC transporter substrate-binding protein [Marinobacter]|uniref:ABC transporter substrate-binding protein n=1 Tax=Marinobacter TaxID=2742 RepID=UPI0007DA0A2A|nr:MULTISPECIES: ABC transporter substrate-binding protein [unclassified Marinobacter]MBL3823497.1 ABC transporter substrate-binding protein [Marinobacter sp. MC3]MBL3891653.1 ABC transporter substrate-binding protein [Marinobacter sp. MW3]OAN88490.1 sugar ABC transporter substrate-binding protein [Marinobacter sp. EhN04]OAN91472.1 sugar ABC transporter substrate-binding protein [Marinobacter sp. EhC06]